MKGEEKNNGEGRESVGKRTIIIRGRMYNERENKGEGERNGENTRA